MLIGIRNAARVLTPKWGRASTIDHVGRSAPATEVAIRPPPRFGIPRMMPAASTKVAASATKRTLIELGTVLKIAAATPKPTAPASIDVAATIALALPI